MRTEADDLNELEHLDATIAELKKLIVAQNYYPLKQQCEKTIVECEVRKLQLCGLNIERTRFGQFRILPWKK